MTQNEENNRQNAQAEWSQTTERSSSQNCAKNKQLLLLQTKNDLAEWFADNWFERIGKNAKKREEPFTHILIHNILRENKVEQLLEAACNAEFKHVVSRLYEMDLGPHLHETENNILRRFDEFLNSPQALDLFCEILQIKTTKETATKLYCTTHIARFKTGDFIKAHNDVAPKRRGTFVLYLTTAKESDGGALELLDDKRQVVQRYAPQRNSILFFVPTKSSLHQVTRIQTDNPDAIRYTLTAGIFEE